jgi:hypothetical protein
VALVIIGSYGGGAWYVVSVIGLVPIVAGAGNFCILKPVLKRSSHAR